jgi:hypothetical protein
MEILGGQFRSRPYNLTNNGLVQLFASPNKGPFCRDFSYFLKKSSARKKWKNNFSCGRMKIGGESIRNYMFFMLLNSNTNLKVLLREGI